jgi:hypothetical protein
MKNKSEDDLELINSLLKKNRSKNELIKECLHQIENEEVLIKSSDKKTKENTKENLLLTYQIKAAWESNRVEKTTWGYESLIESLQKTAAKNIKITEFTSQKATFFIFSNFEITEFIGILKSSQGLGDIQGKLKKL